MARVTIESQAAAAVQGPLETALQDLVVLTMALGACIALAQPGILLSAAAAALWRLRKQPSRNRRIFRSVVAATPLLWLYPSITWAWPWRDLLARAAILPVAAVQASPTLRSLAIEALAGPLWLEGATLVVHLRRRTVHAQVRRDHRLDQRRWRALTGANRPKLPAADTKPPTADSRQPHPNGCIRIGLDLETGVPLDLALPTDLAAHAFLPGASGSGKTNTLARLTEGVLANDYGVVIIDCKAGNLGGVARSLATRYHTPFRLVDPDHPHSLGYNPCTGDAPAVANKLVGTFTFGPSAEIYKHIAIETMSVAVRGLHAAGELVTLESLYSAFAPRGLTKIAHNVTTDERLRKRLLDLDTPDTDRLGAAGRAGLQRRLGALLEGKFGGLFRARPALDWSQAVAEPSVTYLALSALASSEDVDLMGRVIIQDLKQLCARRLRQLADGLTLTPIMLVIDEFAALDEPTQLLDLLRQAREALVTIVLSTQHMPETYPLQAACLGAGLIIAHRVAAPDAQIIAAQFGTRPATDTTHQIDYANGFSEQGSVRRVDKFHVHPNELREFMPGQAAIKCVSRQRYTIVQVHKGDAAK